MRWDGSEYPCGHSEIGTTMIFIWRLGKILKLCNWKIKDWIVILTFVQAFGFAKGNEFLVGNRLVWEVMLWNVC
jgi:hypothetical protein